MRSMLDAVVGEVTSSVERTLAGRGIRGGVDHSAMLSADELRVIYEWLDIGAQNFNDPFDPDAPQN